MFTPSTVQLWLYDQAWPICIIAVLLVGGFMLLKFSAIRRRAAMQRERAGNTEDTFVEHLCSFGFDPSIARSTYQYLQNEQNVHFPILINDRLDEDLGLDLADIDQTTAALVVINKREFRPGVRHEPIETVEDLIRLLQASPRSKDVAA
jgi:hypothetical protein